MKTTSPKPAGQAEPPQGAVSLFARFALECARDARRCKREGREEMAMYYRGQRVAWSLAARHIHPSHGARVRNARLPIRRAA